MKLKPSAKARFSKLVKRYTPLDWKLDTVSAAKSDRSCWQVVWKVNDTPQFFTAYLPKVSDAARVQKDIGEFEALVARC